MGETMFSPWTPFFSSAYGLIGARAALEQSSAPPAGCRYMRFVIGYAKSVFAAGAVSAVGRRFNDAFSGVGLGALSSPAKIIVALVVAAGLILSWLLFVIDSFSDDPSSTAVLIFPALALYVSIAIALIVAIDWAVRRIARRVATDSRRG
jgi:preprotein translocase subunit Sec61beta